MGIGFLESVCVVRANGVVGIEQIGEARFGIKVLNLSLSVLFHNLIPKNGGSGLHIDGTRVLVSAAHITEVSEHFESAGAVFQVQLVHCSEVFLHRSLHTDKSA